MWWDAVVENNGSKWERIGIYVVGIEDEEGVYLCTFMMSNEDEWMYLNPSFGLDEMLGMHVNLPL